MEAPGLHKFDAAKKDATPEALANGEAPKSGEPARKDSPPSAPTAQKRPASAAPLGRRPEKRRKANDIAPQEVELPKDDDEQAVSLHESCLLLTPDLCCCMHATGAANQA